MNVSENPSEELYYFKYQAYTYRQRSAFEQNQKSNLPTNLLRKALIFFLHEYFKFLLLFKWKNEALLFITTEDIWDKVYIRIALWM